MQLTKKKEMVSVEYVFSKIDSYDVYHMYVGQFTVGALFQNPVTEHQQTPSFGIYMKDGKLYHNDFAEPDIHGDCVAIVQQLFQLSYSKAIEKIARDFRLTEGTDEYKRIVKEYVKPVMDQKRHTLIQVTARKWNKADIEYWSQYGITVDDLRGEEVYPVREFYLNRRRQQMSKDERVYGYRYSAGWKIYMIDREKGKRWLSNIPLDTPMHLDNLQSDKNTLIVKSLKDYIVCKKLHPYTCYVQNESTGAVTDKTAQYITENSKQVYYGGDSDRAGKEASYKITGKYGWKHINPPDRLLPESKDFSDWYKEDGNSKRILKHLKAKGVII